MYEYTKCSADQIYVVFSKTLQHTSIYTVPDMYSFLETPKQVFLFILFILFIYFYLLLYYIYTLF
jgi:hypothetical protein